MAVKDKRPKITKTEAKQIPNPPRLEVTDETLAALEGFLGESVPEILRKRADEMTRVQIWRDWIRGENPSPQWSQDISHVSSPLILWARSRMNAKITQSILRPNPPIKIEPIRGKDNPNMSAAANGLTKLFTAMLRSGRELNGAETIRKVVADDVDTGLGAWVVRKHPFEIKSVLRVTDDGIVAERQLSDGFVRWDAIPFQNFLYFDQYGNDLNSMPFVGYKVTRSWASIKNWAAADYYDKAVVDKLEAVLADPNSIANDALAPVDGMDLQDGGLPMDVRRHHICELYMDFDIALKPREGKHNGHPIDGIPEAIVVDYHIDARKVLRVAANTNDGGRRPVVAAAFDTPANPHALRGQGVPEKLEGTQVTSDAIWNITIESGKKAMANLLIFKKGTALEDKFGDADNLINAIGFSDDPGKDAVSLPLGSPEAATNGLLLMQQAEHIVSQVLGEDEAAGGNVQSAKRVPNGLGMAIMGQGRSIQQNAVNSVSAALEEAIYLTLDAWRDGRFRPQAAFDEVLTEDERAMLDAIVFSSKDVDTRRMFLIRVQARDLSSGREQQRQDLMILNQFLIQYFTAVGQALEKVTAAAQFGPAAGKMAVSFIEKLQAGMEALLKTVDAIDDPADIIFSTQELELFSRGMQQKFEELQSQAAGDEVQNETANLPSDSDLGGGVV